jgi:hypothetical protein
MNVDVDSRRQLRIQGWAVTTLVFGFVTSLAISRFAINRLGEVGYGGYALIVGFSGILAFSDLGLLPGVTRGIAPFIAVGDRDGVKSVLRRMDRLAFCLAIVLTCLCAAIVYWSTRTVDWGILHGLAVFGAASFLNVRADTRAALLRVSGAVVLSYSLRIIYFLGYFCIVVTLYRAVRVWNGFWIFCYAQLTAAFFQYVTVAYCLSRRISEAPAVERPPGVEAVSITTFWTEAWHVSSPERLNRVIQLVVGAFERPLLLATAGLALITSYDLLLRLMLLVSAVPAALSQPLLAMLSHDAVRDAPGRSFSGSLKLTRIVSAVCASSGVILAMVLWVYFHHALFGLHSQIPVGVGLLIAIVAAVNVQTAPGTAAQLAHGVVRPTIVKTYTEAAGVVVGGVAAWIARDGLVFLVVRNLVLGLAAIAFLAAENRRCGATS